MAPVAADAAGLFYDPVKTPLKNRKENEQYRYNRNPDHLP